MLKHSMTIAKREGYILKLFWLFKCLCPAHEGTCPKKRLLSSVRCFYGCYYVAQPAQLLVWHASLW
jgi:hypothetical protein